MAVIGSATLNVVPKVQGGLSNAINGEIAKANVSGLGKKAGSGFMGGFASGASIGIWSTVTSKAIGAVTGSLDSAASRVDTLNNYPRIMESLGVSSKDANLSIQTMSDALSNVPTRLDDMASTVQGLFAATQKYGIGIDTVTDAGLALNGMLLAGGQSQQVVNAAMEQFRQMVAKGKPDLQDWRSLISAAPGQMNQLAKSMLDAEATADDLYAALGGGKEDDYEGPYEWGSISMGEFVERFAEMREQFEGAAEEAQGGIGTAFANMRNAVTKGVANVLDAFGQENISSAIGDVKGLINDIFGRDDTEGLRAFATEVAPMVTGAWDSMVSGIAGLSEGVAPAVASVGETLLGVAERVGPPVGEMFGALSEAAVEVAPVLADAFDSVADAIGDGIVGVAEFVTGAAPAIADLATGVLPVVADIASAVAPALPALMLAKTAFGGLGSALGGVASAGGGVASLFEKVSFKALDFATSTGVAEKTAALFGTSLSPVAIGAGAAAAAVGGLALAIYKSTEDEREARRQSEALNSALDVMSGNVDGLGAALWGGADGIDGLAAAAANAEPDIDGLVKSIEGHNRRNAETRQSAEESIYMLGQYKDIIDECAGAGEVDAEAMGRLQWALDGLRDATGESYEASDVLAGKLKDEEGNTVDLKAAIDDLIASKQREARVNALQDMYTDALKEQAKAQQEVEKAEKAYHDAHDDWVANVTQGYIKQGETAEEAARRAETAWANGEYGYLADDLATAKAAYEGLTDEAQTYANLMGDAIEQANEHWGEREGIIRTNEAMMRACETAGITNDGIRDLAESLENAGVSTEQFADITGEQFAVAAEAAGGDIGLMTELLSAYNSEPVVDKEGNVHIEQASLVDAEGNVFTWNGTELVSKTTHASAEDKQLTDAYGNVIKWNGTKAQVIHANITNDSNPVPSLVGWLDQLKSRDGLTVRTNVTNTTTNRTIIETQRVSGGQITKNASGGHIVPRHASGYFATKATRTNFGIVGEDGIEAVWNNDDGTSDVYPLTNPRYLGYANPLADRIAQRMAEQMQGRGGAPQITVTVTGVVGPNEVADAVARRLSALRL